mgnify:FL=1
METKAQITKNPKKIASKSFLKLPYEEYLKIQQTLNKVRKTLNAKRRNYHDTLYVSNSLFECTHSFETGKPHLYK